MARQAINIGSSANDGTGDPLRTAFDKINDNFVELYGGDNDINTLDANLNVNNFAITTGVTNGDITVTPNGTGSINLGSMKFNGTTLSSDDSTIININEGLVVDGTTNVTGTLTANGLINGVQTLTGSGSTEVISLTETVTQLITTGVQNFSLANGTEGQIKIITLKTDGGNATVTPASFLNGTSITFDDVGDTMTMLYQSTGWIVLAQQNTTVNA